MLLTTDYSLGSSFLERTLLAMFPDISLHASKNMLLLLFLDVSILDKIYWLFNMGNEYLAFSDPFLYFFHLYSLCNIYAIISNYIDNLGFFSELLL